MSDLLRWRRQEVSDDPLFDFDVNKARECILWRMSPAEWDALTLDEYRAWHKAWKDIQKESEGH